MKITGIDMHQAELAHAVRPVCDLFGGRIDAPVAAFGLG